MNVKNNDKNVKNKVTVLGPENNGKQNPKERYTNKYQKHIACNYDCKLVCVDDKFSKLFKRYLDEDAVSTLLIIWSQKVNILVTWYKNISTKNLW